MDVCEYNLTGVANVIIMIQNEIVLLIFVLNNFNIGIDSKAITLNYHCCNIKF